MVREKLLPSYDFDSFIQQGIRSNNTRIQKLKNGVIAPDRIEAVKGAMLWKYCSLAIAKYSAGHELSSLVEDLDTAIDTIKETGKGAWLLRGNDGEPLRQYTLTNYNYLLWMLSLSVMLDRPRRQFEKIAKKIDEDRVVDAIFECCLRYKLKDRKQAAFLPNGHPDGFDMKLEMYSGLRKAVVARDKEEASGLINGFLKTEWLQKQRQEGHFMSHASKHNIYAGYWSFGSAAIVKIRGLNDKNFRDFLHYPADLVDVPPLMLHAAPVDKKESIETYGTNVSPMQWREITDILDALQIASGQTHGKQALTKLLQKIDTGTVVVNKPNRDWVISSRDDLQRLFDTYDPAIIVSNYAPPDHAPPEKSGKFSKFFRRK